MFSLKKIAAFHWRRMATLAIAAGLIIWPWLSLDGVELGAKLEGGPSAFGLVVWHAFLIGGALAFLSVLSFVCRSVWLAGLQLIVGLWIAVAPWIIDLGDGAATSWLHAAAGLIIAAMASFDIYREFRRESEIIEHMS